MEMTICRLCHVLLIRSKSQVPPTLSGKELHKMSIPRSEAHEDHTRVFQLYYQSKETQPPIGVYDMIFLSAQVSLLNPVMSQSDALCKSLSLLFPNGSLSFFLGKKNSIVKNSILVEFLSYHRRVHSPSVAQKSNNHLKVNQGENSSHRALIGSG